MVGLEPIREIARRDLVIVLSSGNEDVQLWEHSVRVAEAAERIARMEQASAALDPAVLTAAALYHEAGWIAQYHEGQVKREAILNRLTSGVQRELGAALMERSLRGHLAAETLKTASTCIRMLNDRDIDMLEARLIVEADSLDECGAMCLWKMIRRNALEGTGIEGIIETWRTQKQYGYWEARINDSIRYESVKRIARARLESIDKLIGELRRNHLGEDIISQIETVARSA